MKRLLLAVLLVHLPALLSASPSDSNPLQYIKIPATTPQERTSVAELGVSIEEIMSDYVFGTIPYSLALKIKQTIPGTEFYPISSVKDFPDEDSNFHNYDELLAFFKEIQTSYPSLVHIEIIGKSVEGRDIHAVLISDYANEKEDEVEPAILFMGTHHAREHLSTEVPINLIKRLLSEYETNPIIKKLVDHREIWVIPLMNPDGVVYDLQEPAYRYWRKNRVKNKDGTYGVDLNRNYGFKWGGSGSSGYPDSETYRGPAAWSEPETRAGRDFVLAHKNIKILLSYHTYSELILYPWGYTYDPISDTRAQEVFKTMAQSMANMTGYTPMAGADLYLVAGETGDWAWGTLGIFAFTFELYPRSFGGDGFYPPDDMIPQVSDLNFGPALYLTDLADDPYRVLKKDRWNDALDIFSSDGSQMP